MQQTLHGFPSSDELKEVSHLNDGEISAAEKAHLERTVWRKLDRWVLPACTMFYFLAFLVSDDLVSIMISHI